MHHVLIAGFLLLMAACAYERPQSTVSPLLDSGISSNNGGGVRALEGPPYGNIRQGPP